jgi:CTP-dependent riboflavin kinase
VAEAVRDPNEADELMSARLIGRVQSGEGDAARWLGLFNAAYSKKLGRPVFPGSLNVAVSPPFDWFSSEVRARTIPFAKEEYGGERDILLVPCVIESLGDEPAHLWTTTTAPDGNLVELIAGVHLRSVHGLEDGDEVRIRLA